MDKLPRRCFKSPVNNRSKSAVSRVMGRRKVQKTERKSRGQPRCDLTASRLDLAVSVQPASDVYNESEIQQWREARKNNFPTRANIEKKLKSESANKEEMDSLAKIRRQRKRARLQRNKRNAKRLKLKNETAPADEPVVKKREPTLLRKLLNADIRRDKSQLLQAFRFMVLNSFFKSVPDKPLVFPIITAKNAQPESEKRPLDSDTNFRAENGNAEEVEREKNSALVGAVQSEGDEDNDSDGVSDVVYEPNGEDVISHGGEKSEEGEITD
ncbi:nuclear fragile X mental retardation-interacting protein 1-like [Phalaenopsis equestris]|uniref:nuclear fragile X mental retardation-interacting protein 1-like n=1 Tax=Phalaenopsis equestris TaxID=78828 RepID=UPI0009E20057|nr:nuclear fragile X mental retardation-interacting protein 1-like [Phalaenopsis equestris]